ncbi:PKD domain-containing protein [Rhodocytophaga rosea]|uniref:PKD domain-containing protein n=1 Tax=Rhodocytophaga rosea TaxID=2704465 RepID=A0A6C0GL29_9BACT|nr:PKD domain-containing protein [Rhodocytophaga rosea]QHT68350.1 PKD domain-containing protein [Rhodocytophaga rosea]
MRTVLPGSAKFLLLMSMCALQTQVLFSQTTDLPSQKNKATVIPNKFHTAASRAKDQEKTVLQKECHVIDIESSVAGKNTRISSEDAFEENLKKLIREKQKTHSSARTQATVYTIPVIVHVIHNGEAVGTGANLSAAQIRSQIDVLNEDFRRKAGTPGFNNNPAGADVEIEFALALRDPQGNTLAEPGIHRYKGSRTSWESYGGEANPGNTQTELKPKTIWDPNSYFNIWSLSIADDIIGEAQFPIRSNLPGLDISGYPTGATTDGVILDYRVVGRTGNVSNGFTGRTATHEIGHWLGLRHIWGDDNGGCTKDDFCNDTPKTADKHRGCPSNEDSCTDPGKDMVQNYMDYTDDACVNVFTNDQKARMRTVLETSPRRKELLSSTVYVPANGSTRPIAQFSVNRTTACVGNSIQFTDKSLGNVTGWAWTFYDKAGNKLSEATSQNTSLTFNTSGTYGVRLIASNAIGKDTLAYASYITVLPTASLAFPFSENFEGTTSLANWLEYNPDADMQWNIYNGASAGGNGVQSVYFDNYNGDEENNPYGTQDGLVSTKLNLATNQFAELSFDVAYARYDASYSDSLEILYSTDCGQTFKTFWSKGGQSLATADDTEGEFVPSDSEWRKETISLGFLNGNASVYLMILNKSSWGNNLYLDNIKVQVPVPTQKPTPDFTVDRQTVCAGSSVQFTDASLNYPRTWSWSFAGGIPINATKQHPVVTYQTPGTYAVTLTAGNALGTNTITRQAYITVLANPAVQLIANKTAICWGDSVTLTANGATTYRWLEGTDVIGEGKTIVVKPTANTTYTVEGVNGGNCINSSSIQIAVNTTNLPEQPEAIAGNVASCLGEQNYVITGVAGLTYKWIVSGGGTVTGSGNTATVNWTNIGKYVLSVVASNANGCASPVRTVEVTVSNPPAKPTISINATADSSIVTLTSSIAPSYQWLKNSVVIPGATKRSYNVTAPGAYTVQVSSNGCPAISDASVLTGEEYSNATDQLIQVFPNPVSDKLIVKLPVITSSSPVKLTIFNSLGQRVDEWLVQVSNNQEIQLPVQEYTKGKYVLLITHQNKQYTRSFIKF